MAYLAPSHPSIIRLQDYFAPIRLGFKYESHNEIDCTDKQTYFKFLQLKKKLLRYVQKHCVSKQLKYELSLHVNTDD